MRGPCTITRSELCLAVLLAMPAIAENAPLRLADLERMALESHPAVAQARALVRAAEGRRLQAGLYPNPVIGATGDEISRGPIIRGGEFGAFLEQRIVTAGKLGLSRRVAEELRAQAEAQAQAERQRVLNVVRTLYYESLGAQRLVKVREELLTIATHAVDVSKQLVNVGQADQPDMMAAEIEAQRAGLGLSMAKTAQERTWRQLGAVVGRPALQPAPLEGDLEQVPKLEIESALATLYKESPEIRMAQSGVIREETALKRAKTEKIPDLLLRGGIRYNRELLERGGKPVGYEGFFDVGVQVPIFNRNQGNIETAKAEFERAQLEVERIKLSLRTRLAAVYQEYQDALRLVEKYRGEMIPRAQKSYELYLSSFRRMAAAYPQVLIAQRNLFQLQEDYVAALVSVWRSVVEIQGLLLTSGLEAPMPGLATRSIAGERVAVRDNE